MKISSIHAINTFHRSHSFQQVGYENKEMVRKRAMEK